MRSMAEPWGIIFYRAATFLAVLIALFAVLNFFDNLSAGEPIVPLLADRACRDRLADRVRLSLRIGCPRSRPLSAQHQARCDLVIDLRERISDPCATRDNMRSWKSISSYSQFFCSCRPGCLHIAHGTLRIDTWVSAGVVVAISAVALIVFREWEEWIACVLGLWIAISPWVFGFQHTRAMFINLAVGILITYLALLELWLIHYRSSSEKRQVSKVTNDIHVCFGVISGYSLRNS